VEKAVEILSLLVAAIDRLPKQWLCVKQTWRFFGAPAFDSHDQRRLAIRASLLHRETIAISNESISSSFTSSTYVALAFKFRNSNAADLEIQAFCLAGLAFAPGG
jgi:hypothetical protein